MSEYENLLRDILENGTKREDRTGTGTIGVFGRQIRFNVARSFPLITTKRIHLKSIIHELLWFISGDTNIKYLNDNGVHIWDEWADENGDLGPVYGKQWRSWPTQGEMFAGEEVVIDQLKNVRDSIITNPFSRRHIVTAWNPADIDDMALPPCHLLFQFHVENDRLNLQLYQRSADMFLGVPFNIASYALLLMLMARATGYKPGTFVHTFGDAHIYLNHIEQVKLQLSRDVRQFPVMTLNPDKKDLFGWKYDDFLLEHYNPHPIIKGKVSV